VTDFRVVFDTNVLVSALLFRRSAPRKALDIVRLHGLILLSESTRNELDEVLHRSKFDRYVTAEERVAFMRLIIAASRTVAAPEHLDVCRDPKDNQFLEIALAGDAGCIVSGDSDLLILHPYRGISILSPADFLNQHHYDG
jgi:putative PIN family toxin of toxin-antitoxin system